MAPSRKARGSKPGCACASSSSPDQTLPPRSAKSAQRASATAGTGCAGAAPAKADDDQNDDAALRADLAAEYEAKLGKKPHYNLSIEKMRAAIARSLMTKPRLLLLDEPFGALDEITKSRLDDELLSLWQRLEVTVVLVTHSLSEAVYLGQQVHILAAQPGRLSATLEVNLSERSPETRTTQEFAGYVAEAHRLLALAELGEPSLEPQHTEEAHA